MQWCQRNMTGGRRQVKARQLGPALMGQRIARELETRKRIASVAEVLALQMLDTLLQRRLPSIQVLCDGTYAPTATEVIATDLPSCTTLLAPSSYLRRLDPVPTSKTPELPASDQHPDPM